MTLQFAEGVLVSDPKPKDEEIEARSTEGDAGESPLDRRPPEDLPEELVMGRLGRLDTRRALAELCKSVPGLDEVLLPRGIRADALTRKSGGGAALLRGVARRIGQDPAAWGAFRTAVQEQIPPETFDALEGLTPENLEEMTEAHTTEGLLLAALTAEEEQDPAVVEELTEAWRVEKGAAQKKASEDAHVRDLEAELERLKGENERLSFASRAANERAAALAEEVDVLTGERSGAAERVDELHEELGRVAAERDRIKNALQSARFTDDGFGELLVRAVKNEVGAMPASLDSAARTAHLLEFMGKVLQAQSDLRAPRTQATKPTEEEAEDPDPSPAPPPVVAAEVREDGSRHGGPAAPNFGAIDRIDAAVITHAHLDHCGALPLLVRDRPGLPIYCTPPSAKLIVSALNDHAAMGGGLPGGAPIHEVRKRLVPVPFGKPLKIGNTTMTLTESGHILGAASVLLQSGPATVFHTGDICMEDHFSIPSARLPDVKDIDLLVMEATLADQKPQPFSDSIRTMVETINETTMERGGSVLIPTYALGQAQEIILGLKHYGKEYGLDRNVFIYVDGSVVTTSERLYAEQLGYMKPYLQHTDPRELFFSDNIRAVANDDKARERILSNPCAIIASPVTMQGGASAFYRRRLQDDPTNAVILPSNAQASYGASRAPGEEEGWQVEKVNFAAHCTQEDLLDITGKLKPRQIILIHGSKRRISDLAYRLAPNYKIHTPTVNETVRTVLR